MLQSCWMFKVKLNEQSEMKFIVRQAIPVHSSVTRYKCVGVS